MSELIVKMNKVGQSYRPQVSLSGGAIFEDLGHDFSDPSQAEKYARFRVSHAMGTNSLYKEGFFWGFSSLVIFIVTSLALKAALGSEISAEIFLGVSTIAGFVVALVSGQMAYIKEARAADGRISVITE